MKPTDPTIVVAIIVLVLIALLISMYVTTQSALRKHEQRESFLQRKLNTKENLLVSKKTEVERERDKVLALNKEVHDIKVMLSQRNSQLNKQADIIKQLRERIDELEKECNDVDYQGKSVYVDDKSGTIHFFDSISHAAQFANVSRASVTRSANYHAKTGQDKWIKGKYAFRWENYS